MNRMKCFIMALTCVLLATCPQAESEEGPDDEEETAVTIALTKLDVNDQNLDLSWKIKNSRDHDVWICESLNPGSLPVFEKFLDKDSKTLVIRRRFDLPIEEGIWWEFPFHRARYVRLRSGQEKTESASFSVPVRPYPVFGHLRANAEYAGRLALEIGFYDEDLPGLILQIVELAEKINCNLNVSVLGFEEICDRFFGGWTIAGAFNNASFAYFRNSVTSGGDEVAIPYMGRGLNGEQILRVTVDGVSIPYKSSSPPLTGHTEKRTRDEQRQERSSHNKEKPKLDREIASDRNGT